MSQKPKFIFFKMIGCGHCVHFFESPSKETSPWALLIKDAQVQAAVDPILIEWGIKRIPDGNGGYKTENHPLPDEYKFVNYGPYFYLQSANSAAGGLEMKNVRRTPEDMKKWILENAPKYANAKRPEKAEVRSEPGHPQIFNANRINTLPANLQKRLQPMQPQRMAETVQAAPAPAAMPVQQQMQVKAASTSKIALGAQPQRNDRPTSNLQMIDLHPLSTESVQSPAYEPTQDMSKFKTQVSSQSGATLVRNEVTVAKPTKKFIPRNRRR
ncbi:MAG: hypothetical protein JRZ94_04670 [Nitrososphaerota archaeon]|nr:hypothetical protein [Nitrososphaerota archaeon]